MDESQQNTPASGSQHVVPYVHYVLIWFGLLALTALTVALAGVKLGSWIIISALAIASTKALLVLNVFMHLKFEDRLFKWFLVVAIATLMIFISFTFLDYAFH
jgi:cytochrome c oxidase subunit IV